jgi:DNA helicase-2/ATP-dependent DNA helicase PcrA
VRVAARAVWLYSKSAKIVAMATDFSAFEKQYKQLNPEQRDAVDALKGPVMVIAGPGTGKTTVLTIRIANILKQAKPKTEPERILALTFTESGAVEMRRKLAELIGQDAYRVEVSTFHGFANRIIRDYPDHFPDIVGAMSITEIDQVDILRKLIDAPASAGLGLAKLRPFGDKYFYLKDILHALADLKQQSVSPEEFARIAAEDKDEFYANPDLYNTSGKYEGKMKGKYDSGAKRVEKNLELVRVYEAYQAALRTAKQYDYADMIMYVALALEKNDDLRRVLQDKYDHFLVDEHQDTNDAQNKIIEMLADGDNSDAPNLFVVGDEKQAIFRFQGASLENFHYFKNHYKNVKLIALRSNYRSTQAILDAAQGVSPRETELVAAKDAARNAGRAGHAEHPANLAVLSSPDSEYYFIGQKIKELVAEKTAPEEIVVLYRDNRDAAPLARMLEKLRVPFNIESDQDVLGDLEIKKFVRILRAVQHFGNDVWLAEALHVDFLGIPPMDAYRIMAFAGRRHSANPTVARVKLYDVLHSEHLLAEAGVTGEASKKAAMALAEHLSQWKRAAENDGAAEVFEAIVRDSGFLAAILRHSHGAEKLAKLHALFDLLKSFVERQKNYTLKDFFVYLDLMEEHGVAVKSKDTVRLPGRVRLMTAHKSKGMEFDYVFIMNAVDRKWGSRFHRESLVLPKKIYRVAALEAARKAASQAEGEIDEDDNADERNVFYVALTRARKEVFITMSKADREGKELLPTQFIAELKPEILAPYDVESYEADYAKHRDEIDFGTDEDGAKKSNGGKAKTPDLADKEFLNALFAAQGISVTALNNYLECPWAYFYRNLVRIPEAPNKNLSFGNAVHAALKSWFDEYDAGATVGADYLVRRFEEALAHEPITESEYEEALAKGRKALPAFYEAYHLDWTRHAMNEVRVAGVVIADGTPINGKLDRIEFLKGDDSAQDDAAVMVIDYKTGKPKSRNDIEGNTQSSDGNYKRQLVFYKLLLDKEGKYLMNEGVIQFIEADERGKPHREAFEITHGEVTVLEKQVATVAQEIRDLAFWNKGCRESDCRYCELREGMG